MSDVIAVAQPGRTIACPEASARQMYARSIGERMQDALTVSKEAPSKEIEAFGMRFSTLGLKAALSLITGRPLGAPFVYACTPNAVHVVHYENGDPRFVAGIDGAWLRLCDSRVVARLAWAVERVRLPLALGSDLTEALVYGGVRPNDPVTVIGGNPAMERLLREQFGWKRLNRHEPPYGFINDPVEVERCVDFVLDHPARYVFLACGAPQSELLGLRIVERGGAVGTGLCIGASLLFATGLARRAPRLMQRAGLEWLHRLIHDPKRMSVRLRRSQLPLLWLAVRQLLDRF